MIFWNPSVEAFSVGPFSVRWYGLCWCIGLALSYMTAYYLYKKQKIAEDKFEPLFLYCFVGIIVGARLGHCLFYEPAYFLAHPLEIVLPMKQDPAGIWRFTGFAGLASHGGTLGLMVALWLYVRKTKINLMRVLDNIGIATPIAACFIRIGNLMNSEIVGKFTQSDYGFVFVHNGDLLPRHPAQVYEALAYLLIFFIGIALYRRSPQKVGTGYFFGWCLASIFAFRFIVEFCKEVQEPWEVQMQQLIGLDQGQLLSIPFLLLGAYCMAGGKWCRKLGEQA